MSEVFFEGFFLQAGLIFALGAQNLYVLESGLLGRHRLAVSVTCFLCDFFIIMLGVLGTSSLLKAHPEVRIYLGAAGVACMGFYGIQKLKSSPQIEQSSDPGPQRHIWSSVLKAATFSIVNPHAYLDGLVLIGGYASKYPQIEGRVLVGTGAAVYSLLWFLLLSGASSFMRPLLLNPIKMRRAMVFSGAILLALSLRLSVEVYGWAFDAQNSETAVVLGGPD